MAGKRQEGCYSKLDGPELSLLNAAGEEIHESALNCSGEDPGHPAKSPLLYFDFVEFFGRSGRVCHCVKELGHSMAPPLDLSASRHYDLSEPQLLEWCLHMIEQKRFRSFLSEPPCTTFSPAAHPAVRCYEIPEGFNLSCPKTHQGNFPLQQVFRPSEACPASWSSMRKEATAFGMEKGLEEFAS